MLEKLFPFLFKRDEQDPNPPIVDNISLAEILAQAPIPEPQQAYNNALALRCKLDMAIPNALRLRIDEANNECILPVQRALGRPEIRCESLDSVIAEVITLTKAIEETLPTEEINQPNDEEGE